MIEAGFEDMHLAFYTSRDIGGDGVWDVWQLEGPDMVWFFNGQPHVHVWARVLDGSPEEVSMPPHARQAWVA